MPGFIILPIIFISIVYWMANLNNDLNKFVVCILVMVLVVQCSLAFGTLISVSTPSALTGIDGLYSRLLNYSIFILKWV